jgi:hypothetical protein
LGKEAARNLIAAITDRKTFVPKQIWIEGELLAGKSVKKIDF